jgi:hypothetical protein
MKLNHIQIKQSYQNQSSGLCSFVYTHLVDFSKSIKIKNSILFIQHTPMHMPQSEAKLGGAKAVSSFYGRYLSFLHI